MSLFSSRELLSVLAAVYYPDLPATVRATEVGGRVFRLLWAGPRPVSQCTYLDYHEPVQESPEASCSYLPVASHGLFEVDQFQHRFSEEYTPHFEQTLEGRPFVPSPCIRWATFGSFDEYLSELRNRSSKRFRDDRRLRRKLERDFGPLTFRVHDEKEDVLPFAFEHKGRQWRRTLGTNLLDEERNRRFFQELQERDLLCASTLRISDRILASWLGMISHGTWGGWIFTYDPSPELRQFSLGRQLLYEMLRFSFEAGHAEFDFSAGGKSYKWFFATHARACGPIGRLPTSLRWRTRLRPYLGPPFRFIRRIASRP